MQLISMGEAARLLRVYPDTLLRWEAKGIIKPIKDSVGRRLFTIEQIESLQQQRDAKQEANRKQ